MSTEVLDYFPEEDGYTLSAYIKEFPRVNNAVRIRFRPVDLIERAVLIAFKDRSYEKLITEKLSEALASRITEWTVMKREAGMLVPLEISKENILRLKPALWIRLVNIVIWGIDGGDLDPGMTEKEIDDQLESDLDAVLTGNPVIDKRLEDLRKN